MPGKLEPILRFVSYIAGAVKIYNATSSQVRFENKKIFSSTLKNALTISFYNSNFEVVGLAPGEQ
jgi:hypothetical protein